MQRRLDVVGNIVAGGLIGVGVNAATGATLDHSPNVVFVRLAPLGLAPRGTGRRRAPTS